MGSRVLQGVEGVAKLLLWPQKAALLVEAESFPLALIPSCHHWALHPQLQSQVREIVIG